MSRKAKQAKKAIVLYSVCALICLLNFNIKALPMFLIFIFLIIMSVRTLVKASSNEEDNPDATYEERITDKFLGSSRKERDMRTRREIREKKKLYKEAYKARLAQIEEEFSDDFYDDDDD